MRGKEESYTKEDVKNYFEGIFVREFTLFSGEELECYIEEELGGEVKRSGIRVLRASDPSEEGSSKYAYLNRI